MLALALQQLLLRSHLLGRRLRRRLSGREFAAGALEQSLIFGQREPGVVGAFAGLNQLGRQGGYGGQALDGVATRGFDVAVPFGQLPAQLGDADLAHFQRLAMFGLDGGPQGARRFDCGHFLLQARDRLLR